MSHKQKNITTLTPNKILDLETKRMVSYLPVTTKTVKNKICEEFYHCWWCRLPIVNESPIGCPLSVKITTSEDKEEKVVYYTDGLFCSFNCVKAYIMEHGEHDARYKDSTRLLAMMYIDNKKKKSDNSKSQLEPITIAPSPPWRFLTQYGGHVTPQQYKDMIHRKIYKEKGIVKLQPITTLYEEEEKLIIN